MKYYDLHVFHNKHDSFSVALKSPEPLEDDAVTALAMEEEYIGECDLDNIDYIQEISAEEYKDMTPDPQV